MHMENIAICCSWADATLLGDPSLTSLLPTELYGLIRSASGSEYLDAISKATRLPQCTDRLFALYRPLTPEIAARWLAVLPRSSFDENVTTFSSLVRILPFAPYLRWHVKILLAQNPQFEKLRSSDYQLSQIPEEQVQCLLIAFFRLLTYDPDTFAEFLHPALLPRLFGHRSVSIRYLAIQCLCQLMRFADAFAQKLVEKHIGPEMIPGSWEGNSIDFRVVKLLEEKRWEKLQDDLRLLETHSRSFDLAPSRGRFTALDLCEHTAELAGVLVPRHSRSPLPKGNFIQTPTARRNLCQLGEALLLTKPILLAGPSGSGKTSLVLEAARSLNKHSDMITLQLNEQTDAKSLLGIHTTSVTGGSFIWQPGVLIRAMQEGRWVIIEDIERAPSEAIGLLRPLIENGELFIPSRKEYVRPAETFRLFATTRESHSNMRSPIRHRSLLANTGLWTTVPCDPLSDNEIAVLIRNKYPECDRLVYSMMQVHHAVIDRHHEFGGLKASQTRPPSLRDLLKWTKRVVVRLANVSEKFAGGAIPEDAKIDIFKDAVDCYAQHINLDPIRMQIVKCIAAGMQVSPQQVNHVLRDSLPTIFKTTSAMTIGRAKFPTSLFSRSHTASRRLLPFALTRQACISLETIASATSLAEPVLLVGETGVGKTTIVQHLATTIGQKLTVVNLSQQSEATDVLGGLKPVTLKSMLVPLVDEFSALFDDTFSSKRNEKFQSSIRKSINQENWHRLILLWQEALQMANAALKIPEENGHGTSDAPQSKRRKLATPKYQDLRDRWAKFAEKLEQVRLQAVRGESRLSFAFVEGRLVQAVRNGEWLLLDEINLASPDTLDHIVSLLHGGNDSGPFLQLPESGSMERIIPHDDFRIFAAMNPANDTGKRDLAPGIRSRFTEIFVYPGDDNLDDLVSLIRTYLGLVLAVDERAATDLANAYLGITKLSQENRLTDGAGELPHFTLRSLVRCLQYVSAHAVTFGLRRAICEGFAMSFFTALSRDSELLVQPILYSHILSSVKNPRSFLAQSPKAQLDPDHYITFQQHRIMRGPLPSQEQAHYIITPSVKRNLLNLTRATSMRRYPILLQGPTSAGKTSMIEYLARLTGNKFIRVNNHEHTDLQEYLGGYTSGDDGKLEFKDGVLTDALRHGHWIALDELNLAPSDILEALNRLLDDNRELLVPESQEIIHPHPNFMLFATQNPAGLYGGRKRLSRAFRNRFLELHFDDIPEEELEVILRERSQIAPSFCTQIVAVYKKLTLQRQTTRLFEQRNSFATLRDLFRWAARPADNRQQLAQNGFMLLAERVREPTERQVVKTTIEEVFKFRLSEESLYGYSSTPPALEHSSDVVWTRAMRRLFVLVAAGLENNEPILLVGETGCGKTQICQAVTSAMGKRLNTYNAHTNTETGDLIGSLRPLRNRTELAAELTRILTQLLGAYPDGVGTGNTSLDELLQRFNAMDVSNFDSRLVSQLRSTLSAYNSLFQWVDGSLVQAMRTGEHFLLDEISLADDSVLERLNSVLEPSRAILLAEKGTDDNLVVANDGFQFLATMNPGGDYGKRELSAALRNRLTEIWVPPLTAAEDILPILRSRLRHDEKYLATKMLEFADWFREEFHSSQASSVPLRTLLTWVEFMNRCSRMSPERAFIHGTAMVYIDSLGANPAGVAAVSMADIDSARSVCLEKIGQMLGCDAVSLYRGIPVLDLDGGTLTIDGFSLPSESGRLEDTEIVFKAPTTLQNTMRIVRALQISKPLLLEGSPGVGKTAIVTALARAVGKVLYRVNLSDQTDLMDLFGADVPSESESLGTFAWHDGPLLTAMQSGSWILLDEMNLASQSVLEGLNSCLDHRQEVYIADLDRTFTCHPDFRLFAAQNPHHQGGGRKGLPNSFVNRFTVVYADPFRIADLEFICRNRYPNVTPAKLQNILNIVVKVQDEVSRNSAIASVLGGLNLRDVNRWLDLVSQYPTLEPVSHFQIIVAQRIRSSDQKRAMETLTEGESTSIADSLYSNLSPSSYQIGTAFLKRDLIFQRVASALGPIPINLLPYAKSAATALSCGWPLILSGPSKCGKTTLIRRLAALSGSRLVELPLNADVDAMDLIGGFEQYDLQRRISQAKRNILTIAEEHATELVYCNFNVENTANVLNLCRICCTDSAGLDSVREALSVAAAADQSFAPFLEHLEELQQEQTNQHVRFVWNDGILVNALESGSWLVLDNANQCNAAVLDRLNSLLEPDGALIISENHSSGRDPRVVKPHVDFRVILTMNPQYGELSKAMRNRSLEIHMPAAEEAMKVTNVLNYLCASDIFRLRLLSLLSDGHEENQFRKTSFVIEHLSRLDLRNLGLQSLKPLQSSNERLDEVLEIERSLPQVLDDRSRQLLALTPISQHDIPSQPIHLSVNEPLLALSASPGTTEAAEAGHHPRRLLVGVEVVRNQLRKAVKSAAFKKASELTLLERSSINTRSQLSQLGSVPGIHVFLEHLCDLIYNSVLQSLLANPNLSMLEGFDCEKSVLQVANGILSFSAQQTLDRTIFQAHLQIAKTTARNLSICSGPLAKSFSKALTVLGAGFELSSGNSLQRLWDQWRPRTASSPAETESLVIHKQLVSDFETISLRFPGSVKFLAEIRAKLIEARELIFSQADDQAYVHLHGIAGVLTDLESRSRDQIAKPGQFAPVFEFLCQAFEFKLDDVRSSELAMISIFARRSVSGVVSTLLEKPVPHILSKISSLHSSKSSGPDPDPLGENIGSLLLVKLATCEDQPLYALDYAIEEISALAGSICKHAGMFEARRVCEIKSLVESLMSLTISCHADLLNKRLDRVWVSNQEFLTAVRQLWSERKLVNDPNGQGQDFHDVLRLYLMPALSSMGDNSSSEQVSVGSGLINFSLAALKLFVPDQQLDPAVLPTVMLESHRRNFSELKCIIQAMKEFQLRFAGQSSSLAIRMAEEELSELGQEPVVHAVVRPKVSKLGELCQEFSNLHRAILFSDSWSTILPPGGNPEQKSRKKSYLARKEGMGMQDTIHGILSRLSQFDGVYDDLCMPIMWILKCLHLGIDMITSSHSPEGPDRGIYQELKAHTPMFGSGPRAVEVWRLGKVNDIFVSTELRMQWLHHLSLRAQILGGDDQKTLTNSVRDFLFLMDTFYEQWKSQLVKEQGALEEKSRYYAYRGRDEDADAFDVQEQEKLFPSFEEMDEPLQPPAEPSFDTPVITLRMAELHSRIFSPSDFEQPLRRYLEATAGRLATLNHFESRTSFAPSLIELLPAAVIQMDSKASSLQGKNPAPKINIYTDGSIKEIQKLQQLTREVEDRFRQIGDVWPEHAVPVEVLQCCREILLLRLKEPIAKLLSKAEKLFATVDRWQAVASREFSASNLQTQTSDLIISWRRLELSSWSRLLDDETDKHQDDARAWYFMLYEAIFVNTCAIMDTGRPVATYSEELLRTLEEFLSAASRGQFVPRIQLLEQFRNTLTALGNTDQSFRPIEAAVISVISHYQRYAADVVAGLRTDRLKLEAAIQEQIKMTSWRDSNPISLKDSARRSHNKLFRIVRKYRAVLEKPAAPFPALPALKVVESHKTLLREQESTEDDGALQTALSYCQRAVTGWKTRPERLTNPKSAAASIARVYQTSVGEFSPHEELAGFHRELLGSTAELRSRTPTSLTEENQSLVRNLKEQKKRLLADTFKALSKMGVRRNLSTKELDWQSSTAKILSRSPDIDVANITKAGEDANAAFHNFLDIISKARMSFTDHSDDLATSEVRRGLGFLEGMLPIMVKQRNSISASSASLSMIRRQVSRIESLERVSLESLRLDDGHLKASCELTEERVQWLCEMLELALHILQIHSQHAGETKEPIRVALLSYKKAFDRITTDFQHIKGFPTGLCSATDSILVTHAFDKMKELGEELRLFREVEPNVDYIFRQLIPWTDTSTLEYAAVVNGVQHTSLEEFDVRIRQVSDQVFVAVQQMRDITSESVQSTEDNDWVVKSDSRLNAIWRSLHLQQISQGIGAVFSQIMHLNVEDARAAAAIMITSRPILLEYVNVCHQVAEISIALHVVLTQMAASMATAFTALLTEGFCGPSETSNEKESGGPLDAGTGLGEGEGAEDISKDVADDEDLTEFAQGENAQPEDGQAEASKDAVDIGPDELNGDIDADDGLSDDESSNGEEDGRGDDFDEEVGSVDDLDPSAVDEKMWDDAKQEADKELKGNKAKGEKSDDQTAADKNQEDQAKDESGIEDMEEDSVEDDNGYNDAADAAVQGEAENMDPHAKDEQVMELPDDLQLNEEEKQADQSSDGDMDDLSDLENGSEDGAVGDGDDQLAEEDKLEEELQNAEEADQETEQKATAVEDDVMDDTKEADQEEALRTLEVEMQYEHDQQQAGDAATAGGPQGQDESPDPQSNLRAPENHQRQGQGNADDKPEAAYGDEQSAKTQRGKGRSGTMEGFESETLKKLADVLDKWHQRRDILPADRTLKQTTQGQDDVEMNDADFEHVADEEDEGDARASGIAGQDQAQNLQEGAMIDDEIHAEQQDLFLPDVEDDQAKEDGIEEQLSRLQTGAVETDSHGGAFVPNPQQRQFPAENDEAPGIAEEDPHLNEDSAEVAVSTSIRNQPSTMTRETAAKLWSQYSTSTHQHSLILTEQLRLILDPTLATKLRGDYRTGKRLNIKRIIPYIASQYKRDKIWMRRSVPSKRAYQIMIAVDDSKSMMEGSVGALALETVAMLCKSLSMLEVGEICVIAFGDETNVRIAHPFGQPFTNEIGPNVFQAFSFGQPATNVRRLVAESIDLFQDARAKSVASQSELWQLQLIISDGICEDHDSIQRLVRQAKEEKIMIVFVIVDSVGASGSSIMDLTQASFEPDVSAGGEMKLTMRRYLEKFPFPYYLVVRDVRDLPGVLATALKGWFGQVVDVQ